MAVAAMQAHFDMQTRAAPTKMSFSPSAQPA